MSIGFKVLQMIPKDFWPIQKQPDHRKREMGRPTIMTTEILELLRIAFMMGCSEREACLFAKIHRHTLYRYQKSNPEFCDQKRAWQDWLVIQARFNIVEAIYNGDVKSSRLYLRFYRPNECGAN